MGRKEDSIEKQVEGRGKKNINQEREEDVDREGIGGRYRPEKGEKRDRGDGKHGNRDIRRDKNKIESGEGKLRI